MHKIFQGLPRYLNSLKTRTFYNYPLNSFSTFPTQDGSFKIRQMTLKECETVMKWANTEDWAICEGDYECFYKADPEGYIVGEVNGEVVCSYAAIRHAEYAYLTFHIVKPEHRGKGYGSIIYDYAKSHYSDAKTIVFDAYGPLIDKYTRLGYKNTSKLVVCTKLAEGTKSRDLVDLKKVDVDKVLEYDFEVFGYPKQEMMRIMINNPNNIALGVIEDNQVKGYGFLKKRLDADSYVICPVMADSKEIADKLYKGLQSYIVGKEVLSGYFEVNKNGKEILQEQKWNVIADHMRMYGGDPPKTDMNRNYVSPNY